MSRPGAWTTVWRNMIASLSRKPVREYVAEDQFQNKYYIIKQGKHTKARGYEPAESGPKNEPTLEWVSWLKGTRRFPPSDQELIINKQRQQLQLQRDAQIEKNSPSVNTTDPKNYKTPGESNFKTYKDMETVPGYNPNSKPKE
uniref:NADH dehydrogenase [ubiquinone] 1 alpha subcomplex assembly factor 2 n=1 Tax=Rhabditophanes sp. KR3021 TaxID=114890 RepID=A0AC35TTQ7_9BILA